eukprot:1773720-Rhodomonas_salina.2
MAEKRLAKGLRRQELCASRSRVRCRWALFRALSGTDNMRSATSVSCTDTRNVVPGCVVLSLTKRGVLPGRVVLTKRGMCQERRVSIIPSPCLLLTQVTAIYLTPAHPQP